MASYRRFYSIACRRLRRGLQGLLPAGENLARSSMHAWHPSWFPTGIGIFIRSPYRPYFQPTVERTESKGTGDEKIFFLGATNRAEAVGWTGVGFGIVVGTSISSFGVWAQLVEVTVRCGECVCVCVEVLTVATFGCYELRVLSSSSSFTWAFASLRIVLSLAETQ